MAQFFTFTPKRKEDGAIDFYTLMDVFDERKEDGTTSPAGHGERKIKFNDMKVLIATEKPFAKKAVDGRRPRRCTTRSTATRCSSA
ncbi:MAG: hypothetical protein ACLT75_10220, partial [Alistipes putredinis]